MYSFVLFDLQAEDHTIGGEEGGRISTAIESGEKVRFPRLSPKMISKAY
jgi:hypothetical protein